MASIYLVEASVITDAIGTAATLYSCSGAGYNAPDAPGFYEPRLISPLSLQRSIFNGGTTSGAVGVGAGELKLVNIDGGLDAWINYGFDGGVLTVKIVDSAAAYSTAQTVAVLTMEQPEFTFGAVILRIRDRLQELETRKVQTALFTGGNSLPAGLEGMPGDLQGRPKPRAYGKPLNCPVPCVNTSRLIYQVNTGAVQDVPAVYDRGAALTQGADYTSQADMESVAPAAGNYRVWKAGGFFRVGSIPTGLLTADILQGANAAARTAAQILYALATGPGGIATGDVSAADVTALDTANSGELGIWIDAEGSTKSAMEIAANSVGAWFGFDRLGKLRMRQFAAPSGSPVAVLDRVQVGTAATATTGDILAIERIPMNDSGNGLPTTRATLSYQVNYSVQTSDIAGVATAARREFLRQAARQVFSTDAAVLTQYRLAITRDFGGVLDSVTVAQAECDRVLALHKVRRDHLQTRIKFDSTMAALIDLGATVSVQINRFGYGGGKLFSVIALDYNAANDWADVNLWG
jgi:hypothetical protein